MALQNLWSLSFRVDKTFWCLSMRLRHSSSSQFDIHKHSCLYVDERLRCCLQGLGSSNPVSFQWKEDVCVCHCIWRPFQEFSTTALMPSSCLTCGKQRASANLWPWFCKFLMNSWPLGTSTRTSQMFAIYIAGMTWWTPSNLLCNFDGVHTIVQAKHLDTRCFAWTVVWMIW